MKGSIFRAVLFCIVLIMCTSCKTVYTEKQTEALSQVVYATKDSLDAARIDLADTYATEATRIVRPPKERLEVQAIYEKSSAVLSSGTKNITPESKQRVVMIPEKYKQDIVVVVSSAEYDQLLKDKENFDQIQKDHEVLVKAKQDVDEELTKQTEYKDQMIKDLNQMQTVIAEKNLTILKQRGLIISLVIAIAAGIYLRMKGIL